jgi:hypothetical protein
VPKKARDVEAALKQKGFEPGEKKRRDHLFFFFYYNGKKSNIFTKMSHGESEIHHKNCAFMAKNIKLSNPQFNEFVDCNLTGEAYLKFLVDSKHLI